MTQAERRAAQDVHEKKIGPLMRELTDLLNKAASEGLYGPEMPQSQKRVLSTVQVAAQQYAPAA